MTVGNKRKVKRVPRHTGAQATLPPGPRSPDVVQAAEWALRPLTLMERCHARYGDIFTLRIRHGRPWVFLTSPEHVKQVFTTDPQLLRVGAADANPLLGPLLGPRSVTLLDEPEHMSDRKRILPSFHGERMREYDVMMCDVARRQIEHWPEGEPFALWPRMQAISREVVMRAVFGDLESERMDRLRDRLIVLTRWVNSPRRLALLAAFGPRSITARGKFGEVVGPVEEIVLEEVRERRARSDGQARPDILSMLEHAYNADGSPMSEDKLRDELVTLLSDGPTATSLAWTFQQLLRHPDKLARLRHETLSSDSDEYVDAVVKETLRLCPAVPVVMRQLSAPMELGGYTMPVGTSVTPCIYLMHRRADIYPEPARFQPERFCESAPGTYTWIPFGGGARRCLAAGFALLEMKRVIQVVLSEVELTAADPGPVEAARSSVSFAPNGGAMVVARRRVTTNGDISASATLGDRRRAGSPG